VAADNAGSTRTDVTAEYGGSGAATSVSRSDHTHTVGRSYGATIQSPTVGNYDLGVVDKAGTAVKIRGKCLGGTSVAINFRKNGVTSLLAAPLTVPTGATYTVTVTFANTALAVDDYMELIVSAVTGGVTSLTAQLSTTESD
jgi:hypothetical protein